MHALVYYTTCEFRQSATSVTKVGIPRLLFQTTIQNWLDYPAQFDKQKTLRKLSIHSGQRIWPSFDLIPHFSCHCHRYRRLASEREKRTMSSRNPDPEKDELSVPPYSIESGSQYDQDIERDAGKVERKHWPQSPTPPSSGSISNEEKDGGHTAPTPISQASTLRAEPVIIVSRSKRRGLLGGLTLLAEVKEPKNYARSTKWFITFVVAVAAMAAPMGSSIFYRL